MIDSSRATNVFGYGSLFVFNGDSYIKRAFNWKG